ncbi:MAG: glycosyltransferase [Varibaculum sp.]
MDFIWLVLGEGDQRAELEAMIHSYRLEQALFSKGMWITPILISRRLMSCATIRYEGYSLALQEARIIAKPIVASDVPSSREQIIDGRNGILVRLDETALADGISRLLGDSSLCGT